ncbi:MAG: hypothetical protein F6K56_24810 [Moorea sp. SIO3G5]|nr:hypothetical protein [Moorena sp. SIO3G5]
MKWLIREIRDIIIAVFSFVILFVLGEKERWVSVERWGDGEMGITETR